MWFLEVSETNHMERMEWINVYVQRSGSAKWAFGIFEFFVRVIQSFGHDDDDNDALDGIN